ncbi:SDR family oxidoreductase [Aggregatilinea lenta]|uniref:SDR family oxidoreductase n=1 Tax=Aggregatilinea lenta TaxID=913108 RepID=UPI001EE92808|nr:SDR family oxidoreductase [Aggregatilinea lenta]
MAPSPMSGKICMVTGATGGLGYQTALALARQGAHVIVVGRSADKGRAALDQIRAATGSETLTFMQADLASQADIRALADAFLADHDRLDVLVNNVGGRFKEHRTSPDGIEMTFALNHLGPFLLTHLLLDTLKASAPARIVNVASGAHYDAAPDFDDLQNARGYDPGKAYRESKLANVWFTYELARRLAGTGVTVNAADPGNVWTNFFKAAGLNPLKLAYLRLRAASPEDGARTIIHLASSPEVEGVSGEYFYDCQRARSSALSYDEAAAGRLWAISESLTGLESPAK